MPRHLETIDVWHAGARVRDGLGFMADFFKQRRHRLCSVGIVVDDKHPPPTDQRASSWKKAESAARYAGTSLAPGAKNLTGGV